MSILPLQFRDGDTCTSLNLTGKEIYSIEYNIHTNEKLAIVKVRFLYILKKCLVCFSSLIMVKPFQ
jgi:aconitase A